MDHSLQMIRQYTLQQEAREWYLEHCKERPTSWLHGQQRKKKEKPIENMLKNKIIPSKESTQFLRITQDSRFNWKEHFNKFRAEAKRALNTIKIVTKSKKW